MKPPAVIFDRDGTLASVAHHLPLTDDAAWQRFNAGLVFDAPVPEVAALLRSVRPGVTRIMTSGRREGAHPGDRRLRFRMQDWLAKHRLPIDVLLMRAGGDYRIDSEVKARMYAESIAPRFRVLYVVDDRPQVVAMWRSLGLPVLAVKDPGVLPPIARQTFVCPVCAAESWHPEDLRHGYCGRCHAFTGRPYAGAVLL